MAKLHEILAVEQSQKGQMAKILLDLNTLFSSKRHHFEKKVVTFTSNAEGAQPVVESQSDIQTTVAKELNWASKTIISAIDTAYQVDIGNTLAKGDIVVNGETLAKDVPATALLQLEKQLQMIKNTLTAIPTLDPALGFSHEEADEKGVYKARDVNTKRTRKDQIPLVMYDATDKHPAQVQLVGKDVEIGVVQKQEWSSLITPAIKADLLDKAEELIRAVKRARARANEQAVDQKDEKHKIGKVLLNHILSPLN